MKAIYLFMLMVLGSFLISSIVPPYFFNENGTTPSLIAQKSLISEEEQDNLRILSYFYSPTGDFQVFDCLNLDFTVSNLYPLVFDCLVVRSYDSGKIIPSLAESWVVSLDSQHWTFFLRNDVLFHDGTPFNAHAVKFSYDRLINSSNPAYIDPLNVSIMLQSFPLVSVEVKDTFSVTFHFEKPYAPFLYNEAAWIAIYSPASFSGPNITFPIGTGPYQYVDSEDEFSTLFLTRISDYHQGTPPFSNITFNMLGDYDTYSEAIHNHEGDIGLTALFDLPEDDNYWNLSFGYAGHELGWFNHSNPFLANSKVRAAINHAIDKEDFTNQFSEEWGRGIGFFTSLIYENSPFYNDEVPGYPFNLDLANSLLDEAGYPRGDNGYRFTLNLGGASWREGRVNYVRNQLTKLGINTSVSISTNEAFIMGEEIFDIYLLHLGADVDPNICWDLLHTNGSLNYGSFSNSYLDVLLSMSQYTPVTQERKFLYRQIQQFSQEMVPYLLLQEDRHTYLRASNITSLIKENVDAGLSFVFLDQENQDLVSMEEIPISNVSLYFQLVDTVISPSTSLSDATVTLVMTHNPYHILPETEGTGKFYSISSNEQESSLHNVRFYYDKEDFDNRRDFENLILYKWNEVSRTWQEIEPISINLDFQYIEVSLSLTDDPLIFNLGFDILVVTFQYLFPYLILIGTILSLGTVVIILNRFFVNNLKEEFLLP